MQENDSGGRLCRYVLCGVDIQRMYNSDNVLVVDQPMLFRCGRLVATATSQRQRQRDKTTLARVPGAKLEGRSGDVKSQHNNTIPRHQVSDLAVTVILG